MSEKFKCDYCFDDHDRLYVCHNKERAYFVTEKKTLKAERDRLKAESAARAQFIANIQKSHFEIEEERDIWKKRAEKLADTIEDLSYYDETSVLKAKEALAEFKSGEYSKPIELDRNVNPPDYNDLSEPSI